jgi:acyl-CoA synthetase (AMP-forming)/AMP-acid ligase II
VAAVQSILYIADVGMTQFGRHLDKQVWELGAEAILLALADAGAVQSDIEQVFLHITDRKKDGIISGGFKAYPSEVEQVIWSHPAVLDCAVIGVPDEKWGEADKAVVELKPGTSADPDEIIALSTDRLGSVKAPKSVDFADKLPRSPVGKVLMKDIRASYWTQADRKI